MVVLVNQMEQGVVTLLLLVQIIIARLYVLLDHKCYKELRHTSNQQ